MLRTIAAMLAAATLSDPTPPSAYEAKKVIDYYYSGRSQGPLLVDLKACLKVDIAKGSPTFLECTDPVKGPVKKGSLVHLWALLMVPDPGVSADGGTPAEEEVTLQFLQGTEVKMSLALTARPGLRDRIERARALNKPGQWELRLLRAGKVLGSVSVTVE